MLFVRISGSFSSAVRCIKGCIVTLAYKLGVSNGKCETLRDGETDTFSASPRLP